MEAGAERTLTLDVGLTMARLTESVTYPSGTIQLSYETAGAPTYGNMAEDDSERR